MTRSTLSVVVAVQEHTALGWAACFDALRTQRGVDADSIEIVVVDATSDRVAARSALDRPGITVLEAQPDPGLPLLFGRGIERAAGHLVAFTEACCVPAVDWARHLIALDEGTEAAAVGGTVAPAPGLSAAELGLFYCDYADFVPPVAAGEVPGLAGTNVAIRRALLRTAGPVGSAGFWKTFFTDRLRTEGHRLILDSAPAVTCGRRLAGGAALRRRSRHGRCFGARRGASEKGGRRALRALVGPGVPALLIYRTFRSLRPKREHRARALRVLGWIVLHQTAWALGEWIGNLMGEGDTCQNL